MLKNSNLCENEQEIIATCNQNVLSGITDCSTEIMPKFNK